MKDYLRSNLNRKIKEYSTIVGDEVYFSTPKENEYMIMQEHNYGDHGLLMIYVIDTKTDKVLHMTNVKGIDTIEFINE